jgi:WD40 repeat protein/transcriptional regulator with XRE-family HTH domain
VSENGVVNLDILAVQALRRLNLIMPRASRSWRVREDCIEIVKNATLQKHGRQENLAEKLGIARSTVSKYLNGRSVDIAQFKEISFFLGFDDGTELACLPDGTPLLQTEAPVRPATSKTAIPLHLQPRSQAGIENNRSTFYGRLHETTILSQWVLVDRCQVLAVLGMGGIGKTTLTQNVIEHEQYQQNFEIIVWRSLRQSPPLAEVLSDILKSIIPNPENTLPDSTAEMVTVLVDCLRNIRCLIVLDNLESIFVGSDTKEGSNQRAGCYRQGYENYGELIRQLGEYSHQSCLLLTSREKPKEITVLETEKGLVRSLLLSGLESSAAQEILQDKQLSGTPAEVERLIQIYTGNPLALKLVANTIQELFTHNISEFLAAGTTIFGYVGELLDEQFNRLSPLEQNIMFWLAIHQEPITLAELSESITTFVSGRELLEALESLGRRSLLETDNNVFGQQPVIVEYILERLVTQICKELVAAEPTLLKSHALLKARAKDYIRESQIRLILEPIVAQIKNYFRTPQYIAPQCQKILSQLQQSDSPLSGYAAGNLINLMCQLGIDFTGYDFSHLTVWQAYLYSVNLHQVNFSHADLEGSLFKETFGGVLTLALSADGKLLATAGTDGAVRLWQTSDGKLLWVSRGHNHWIFSLTFSPDQTQIISGSPDTTLRFWDVITGEQLNLWRNPVGEINAIALNADGILVAGGSEPQVPLVDTTTRTQLRELQGHTGSRILAVACSPDGETVLTGSTDRTLKLWDIATGNCQQTLVGHTGGVRSVTFSPDGKIIASGSIDRTIKLWQTETGHCLQTLTAHQGMILDLAFSPDGKHLTTASMDRTLRVWRVDSGQCIRVLKGHTKPVWAVVYSPEGKMIVSGGDDCAVKFWDAETGQCLKTWQGNSNAITSVAYPAGSLSTQQTTHWLASGSEDRHIRLWDVQTGQCRHTLVGHKGRVVSLRHSPDGQTLLSGSWDGTAKLWNLATGECLETLYGHSLLIWSVAISPDNRTLATASEDGTIRLWSTNGQCLQVFAKHQGAVHTIAFSPDGQWLASGGIDGALRLWNLSGEKEESHILATHDSPIRSIAFSHDGHHLFSTSKKPTINLWNLQTGERSRVFRGHQEAVWAIALSPDGCLFASGSEDKTVKIWELASGKCLHTFTGHQSLVVSVSFHPTQPLLVSGSLDETIRVWDIHAGDCLNTLRVERPYEGMNITGVTGMTEAQKDTLKILGAIEN